MDDGQDTQTTERPGRRQTVSIPRKPVPSYLGVQSLRTQSKRRQTHHTSVNSDGVSVFSRLSTLSIPGVDAALVSTFSPNTQRKGSRTTFAGDQNISPISENESWRGDRIFHLMEISAEEAAYRKNSVTPSFVETVNRVREESTTRESISVQVASEADNSSLHFPEWPCNWLPFTLRWPYLMFMLLLTLVLCGMVLGITLRSDQHQGLGTNHNKAGIIFGWRFTPTILAVIYMLFLAPLVNDAKRTEPFARLSSSKGVSASSSLFWKGKAFWVDPFIALNKGRNGGFRSWVLFWASIANIFGLLVILPFSSALLFPTEVLYARNATFSSTTGTNLVSVNGAVYDRTISDVLLNTTTSPWMSNNYTIIPFSPSKDTSTQLGIAVSQEPQQWTANTTVFQTSLDCNPMNLKGFDNYTMNATLLVVGDTSTWIPTNLTSFQLGSADGCTLGFASLTSSYINNSIWTNGGGWWSGASNFSYPLPWSAGNGTIDDLGIDRPIIVNTSSQCGNRTMLVFAAPEAYGLIQAQGFVCTSKYYSANLPVTVTNTGSTQNTTFDTSLFEKLKTTVSSGTLDISAFENSFLSQNWSSRLQLPGSSSNTSQTIAPSLAGPMFILAAENNYNISAMIENPNIIAQAQRMKQQFLSESLLSSFNNSTSSQSSTTIGTTSSLEERIAVSFGIGILLFILLLSSALILCLIAYLTRLSRRPLNLHQDPSSIASIVSLVRTSPLTRSLFEGMDRASEKEMTKQLDGYVFALRSGVLWSYDLRDAYQQQVASENSNQANCYSLNSRAWTPKVLRFWVMVPLLVVLLVLGIIVGVLYGTLHQSGILQNLNIFSPNGSHFRPPLEAGAGYSILSTLVAVGMKVWWNEIDSSMRRLALFFEMTRGPVRARKGMDLSYATSPFAWIVGTAARNEHLVLAVVALGSVLVEILVISMAGLWLPKLIAKSQNIELSRQVGLRTDPIILEVPAGTQSSTDVLSYVFGNLPTIATSTSLNTNNTSSPWMKDDWVFAPTQLSSDSSSLKGPLSLPKNLTITTPSIRGHLQCSAIDTSSDSTWLSTIDLNTINLSNGTSIPCNLTSAFSVNTPFSPTHFPNITLSNDLCELNRTTTLGSWSPDPSNPSTNIIVSSITGQAFTVQTNTSSTELLWSQTPTITALNCTPFFETASSNATIDSRTGTVLNYTILSIPVVDKSAWTYGFTTNSNVTANVSASMNAFSSEILMHNISVSYGTLLTSLLTTIPFPTALLQNQTLSANTSSIIFTQLLSTLQNTLVPSTLTPSLYLTANSTLLTQSLTAPLSLTATQSNTTRTLSPLIEPSIITILILMFLLLTTMMLLYTTRTTLPLLPRDTQSIGSILGFIHSSDRLFAYSSAHDTNSPLAPFEPPTQPQNQPQPQYLPYNPTRRLSKDETEDDGERITLGQFTNQSQNGREHWGIEILPHSNSQTSSQNHERPEINTPTRISNRLTTYFSSTMGHPGSPQNLTPSSHQNSDENPDRLSGPLNSHPSQSTSWRSMSLRRVRRPVTGQAQSPRQKQMPHIGTLAAPSSTGSLRRGGRRKTIATGSLAGNRESATTDESLPTTPTRSQVSLSSQVRQSGQEDRGPDPTATLASLFTSKHTFTRETGTGEGSSSTKPQPQAQASSSAQGSKGNSSIPIKFSFPLGGKGKGISLSPSQPAPPISTFSSILHLPPPTLSPQPPQPSQSRLSPRPQKPVLRVPPKLRTQQPPQPQLVTRPRSKTQAPPRRQLKEEEEEIPPIDPLLTSFPLDLLSPESESVVSATLFPSRSPMSARTHDLSPSPINIASISNHSSAVYGSRDSGSGSGIGSEVRSYTSVGRGEGGGRGKGGYSGMGMGSGSGYRNEEEDISPLSPSAQQSQEMGLERGGAFWNGSRGNRNRARTEGAGLGRGSEGEGVERRGEVRRGGGEVRRGEGRAGRSAYAIMNEEKAGLAERWA